MEPLEDLRVPSRVYKNFLHHVSREDVKVENAMDVIKSLWYVVDGFGEMNTEEKKKVVILALEDLASGKDGVLNTDDDIIPPHILKGITLLIECNLVMDMIDLIYEVTQAKQCMSWSMYVCRILSYLTCCCPCGGRKKESIPVLRIKSKSLPTSWKKSPDPSKQPLLTTSSLPDLRTHE